MGRGPKPAKSKGESKPPVAPKPPKDDGARIRDLEKRLAEALRDKAQTQEQLQTRDRELAESQEQQTATSEILRVISSSPGDLQPVMQTIVDSAVRLADADNAMIGRAEGDHIRWLAVAGTLSPERPHVSHQPINRSLPSGRAIIDRQTTQVEDISVYGDEFPGVAAAYRKLGVRTILATPLLREGNSIGVILVRRTTVRPFTDQQIALLRTFADQAVIAIENVRLFNETKEALDRQTATSEILRVISQSPTDVQPVFETIVRNATKLCDGTFSAVFRWDGALLDFAAAHNWTEQTVEAMRAQYPVPATRGTGSGRAILDRAVVQIADIEHDPEYRGTTALAVGFRSGLFVPMMREGTPVGAISVGRATTGPFSNGHVELLKTFADQAVIAIENVRLFTELKEKNQALTVAHAQVTEALDQQTATAEILRVISSSPTDVQPVFDAIVRNAVRLCGGVYGTVYRSDGEMVHLVPDHHFPPDQIDVWRTLLQRVSNTGQVHRVSDLEAQARALIDAAALANWDTHGVRSCVVVPMFVAGQAIGAIGVSHADVNAFSDADIALLQTFADQAVIAIENVRLFTELRARTDELTRSVNQLTALGEVGQAVSSTLDLDTVLTTIVSRATELAAADGGAIYEYDDAVEQFRLRAGQGLLAGLGALGREVGIRKGEGALGRVAVTREPIQIADIAQDVYQSRLRGVLLEAGIRSLLAVPLLREDRLIGGLVVNRKQPGEFPPEVIEVLKTFATQSALAIQNARLFREIADKSRQLEVASQHKSEFLANMSHELRTPLNAIIGFSEVLTDRMFGDLNEKQEEYLKDIYASGTHLLSLINDILDLSKIEAGRMELELTDFHLPTALDNAMILVRERAGRRNITLQMSVDERLGEVRADERKIRQVVLNLLSNAIKFTPEGGRIEVAAVPKDGSVEVSVSDTGVGIAPEDQEAVFEEFRQVGTADKKAEGTGLGLTLCRKFIELHGGRIWINSQVGVGSTFTFTVPVRRGE
jgi:two-component system, NtrC family, sensor kinase